MKVGSYIARTELANATQNHTNLRTASEGYGFEIRNLYSQIKDLKQEVAFRFWLTQEHRRRVGLSDVFTAGLGLLFAGIFSIVVLAVFGGFATIAAIWPSANATKITTNIANAVVAGAAFLSIEVLLIEVGFIFVILGMVAAVLGTRLG